jgi:hypothetical protein
MIKRILEWLYIKFVIIPAAHRAMEMAEEQYPEGDYDFEIEFGPDEEMKAAIESKGRVKH